MGEQARTFLDPALPHGEGHPAFTWTAGEVCAKAVAEGARVVHLCGERPGGGADGFARWRAEGLGDFEPRPEGHYLRDLLVPVLRYQGGGAKMDIRSVGEWFGDHTDATPAEAESAFDIMREVLARRVDGAVMWASPQATGTDLLLRTLPAGREWAPLDRALQDEIRTTATQGRVETWPACPSLVAGGTTSFSIPRLVEYDGRFMYSALCAELPEGDPVGGQGWPDPDALGYLPGTDPVMVRGRFLVEWRAPADWRHVGILPHLGAEGWTWPVSRKWMRGWVDGAELLVAVRWGWEVRVKRHVCWPRPQGGGPLKAWAATLVEARDHARLFGGRPSELAQAGLRAILLTTVGVLHGRAHTHTKVGDEPEPGAKRARMEGGQWVWQTDARKVEAARPEFAHPEWSAAVWARCRARLLDARGAKGERTGALHVDPASIVAFSLDALYLTDDPGWTDDGRVGRLRRRANHEGPMAAPASRAELLALLRERRA